MKSDVNCLSLLSYKYIYIDGRGFLDADSNLFIGTLRLNQSDREVRDAAKADTRGPPASDTVHLIVSNDDYHRQSSSSSSPPLTNGAPPGEGDVPFGEGANSDEDEHRDQGKVIERATTTHTSTFSSVLKQ